MKINVSIAMFILVSLAVGASGQVPDKTKVVAGAERAFEKAAKINAAPAPGCAVGVSLKGESVFEKAFGLAEMEHNIPNTPQTIFESGSVAKQFTAAALVLLQQEGKLSLDDPVRKYIPELPDYGTPLTIRHMLNHTSGIRDWISVRVLSGEGSGEHVVNQQMVFDTVVRQKSLDFTPGSEYSYSNSGYQLAATIVERVSKQKFPDFVGEQFFKPLGMKNSSYRDDFQRIVPGRASAYSKEGKDPWRLNMPMMNVFGGGGMLTTVGDWLKWNAMLDSRSLGVPLVEALETQGILNGEQKINYALGLSIDTYNSIKRIGHTGSTAGYRTDLSRFPDKNVSIAVLCNGTSPNPSELARSIADEILGPFPAVPAPAVVQLSDEKLKRFVGIWRNEKTHLPGKFTFENGGLRFNDGPVRPFADDVMMLGNARMKFSFDKDGKPFSGESIDNNGSITRIVAETAWTPTSADLGRFSGEWFSNEAQAKFTFLVENDTAFLLNNQMSKLKLEPLYSDHFSTKGWVIWFTRDRKGRIDKMHVGRNRLRDMAFERLKK